MSSSNNDLNSISSSKIVEISAFKKKRDTKEQIARSRKPLYVNSSEGTISDISKSSKVEAKAEDFGDRLVKIRGSLDRINQLMAEIKKLSVRDKGTKDNLN